jgi:hypothetical protein
MIAQVRKYHSKRNDQLITIKDFCDYMDLDEQEVRKAMIN